MIYTFLQWFPSPSVHPVPSILPVSASAQPLPRPSACFLSAPVGDAHAPVMNHVPSKLSLPFPLSAGPTQHAFTTYQIKQFDI